LLPFGLARFSTSMASPTGEASFDARRHVDRAQRLSPVELTRSVLARIDRLDSRLHSYATAMEEQALAAAGRAAAEVASEQ